MMRPASIMLALVAMGSSFALGSAIGPHKAAAPPAVEPTYRLLAQTHDGSSYEFESRATLADCMDAARGLDVSRFAFTFCEKENR